MVTPVTLRVTSITTTEDWDWVTNQGYIVTKIETKSSSRLLSPSIRLQRSHSLPVCSAGKGWFPSEWGGFGSRSPNSFHSCESEKPTYAFLFEKRTWALFCVLSEHRFVRYFVTTNRSQEGAKPPPWPTPLPRRANRFLELATKTVVSTVRGLIKVRGVVTSWWQGSSPRQSVKGVRSTSAKPISPLTDCLEGRATLSPRGNHSP